MKAAVLKSPRCVVIEDRPDPTAPPPGFVRVRIKSVGICGSDLHYYEHGRIGDFVVREPLVLGHETSGVIDAIGTGVTDLRPGDIVALEPGIPCGACAYCRTGAYNLCPDVQFFATPPVDGTLQEYIVHPAAYTYRVEELTPDEAFLAEPLSVGVFSVRRTHIAIGMRVLVVGAGSVGLLTALAAEAQGADVILLDVNQERVNIAREMGFRAETRFGKASEEVDVVFECSGSRDGIRTAERAVRRGGTIALIGMGSEDAMMLRGLHLNVQGIQVMGIFRYANTYPSALALIQRYRERLKSFQQVIIELEEIPRFLQTYQAGTPLKTIVHVS
jgi:L-iditol 2-dehydrogenase